MKTPLFSMWGPEGSTGSSDYSADETQPEPAASTDLVFQQYPFADGTTNNVCFSEDGGATCQNILHAGRAYQVNLRVFNIGGTPSAEFTVTVRLEPDGFYTTEADVTPVEQVYEGQSLLPGQGDDTVHVTLPPMQEGQHYNLKAQITVNGQPLPHAEASTSYDNFVIQAAESESTDYPTDSTGYTDDSTEYTDVNSEYTEGSSESSGESTDYANETPEYTEENTGEETGSWSEETGTENGTDNSRGY